MGSLIKIDEFTVSSPLAEVIIGGGTGGSSGLNASIDSTYDVYQLVFSNFNPQTDVTNIRIRVTVSGSPDSSANYDYAGRYLAYATPFNWHSIGQTQFQGLGIGTNTGEVTNQVMYLYNFNNASEYSFITIEESARDAYGSQLGFQGGIVNTVIQACDGIQFIQTSGNINTGSTFTLYGLQK
jgi:hypothetical protein